MQVYKIKKKIGSIKEAGVMITDIFLNEGLYVTGIELEIADENHLSKSNIIDDGVHVINTKINKLDITIDMCQ